MKILKTFCGGCGGKIEVDLRKYPGADLNNGVLIHNDPEGRCQAMFRMRGGILDEPERRESSNKPDHKTS